MIIYNRDIADCHKTFLFKWINIHLLKLSWIRRKPALKSYCTLILEPFLGIKISCCLGFKTTIILSNLANKFFISAKVIYLYNLAMLCSIYFFCLWTWSQAIIKNILESFWYCIFYDQNPWKLFIKAFTLINLQ